ncbi:hypothetical protein [Curtobacterium sp. 458]|uniref:hypothetical protein n=1 Tax=Curtobacterium sp. 458 TaxID=3050069 RepID=UPI0025B33081|nr:hypothetical protein [Curtobacterium sp. 458]WJX98910.1 hypothetical protein QPJ90_11280 [Curtobacterium sp. 458]
MRVGYGVTTSAAAFRDASEVTRHRARIDAVVSRSKSSLIVSHESAVVMLGLPWFGPLPERVLFTDPGRDRAQRLRFSDKVPARGRHVSTVAIDGIETTDLVETAVDVALRADRGHAIVVLDAVLRRGASRELLLVELSRRTHRRGVARARRLIEIADGSNESPGESLTHLVAHDVGLPAPVLQHEFRVVGRFVARVDFWFPEQGVVIEFDGLAKYRDRTLRGTRTPEDVVVDEKLREDAVRSLPEVRGFGRVTWRDVLPGGAAPTVFAHAGLPVSRVVRTTPPW